MLSALSGSSFIENFTKLPLISAALPKSACDLFIFVFVVSVVKQVRSHYPSVKRSKHWTPRVHHLHSWRHSWPAVIGRESAAEKILETRNVACRWLNHEDWKRGTQKHAPQQCKWASRGAGATSQIIALYLFISSATGVTGIPWCTSVITMCITVQYGQLVSFFECGRVCACIWTSCTKYLENFFFNLEKNKKERWERKLLLPCFIPVSTTNFKIVFPRKWPRAESLHPKDPNFNNVA